MEVRDPFHVYITLICLLAI